MYHINLNDLNNHKNNTFLIYLKVEESENQQVEEECVKQDICVQVCTSNKCKLRDIEDCVVSTDTGTATEEDDIEVNEIHEENPEKLAETENEEEEVSKATDGNEISDTTNEVGIYYCILTMKNKS